MATQLFCTPLKTIAQRFMVTILGICLGWGLAQPVALAAALHPVEAAANMPIALAASSRFAAQAEDGMAEPTVSQEKLGDLREQRREWQSEVSAAAYHEKNQPTASDSETLGGTLKDRLNLDEIVEENEIIDELDNLIHE